MSRLPLLFVAVLAAGSAHAAGPGLQPGEWHYTARIVKADIPGAPAAALQAMIGRTQLIKSCLTPEQAARDPRAAFENGQRNCSYEKFVMAGGRMSSVMACKAGKGTTRVTTTGRYSPTGYTTHSTLVSTAANGKVTMVSDGVGKRVGPCRK